MLENLFLLLSFVPQETGKEDIVEAKAFPHIGVADSTVGQGGAS